MRYALLLLSSAMLLEYGRTPVSAAGEHQPTLQETVEWLTSKLREDGGYRLAFTSRDRDAGDRRMFRRLRYHADSDFAGDPVVVRSIEDVSTSYDLLDFDRTYDNTYHLELSVLNAGSVKVVDLDEDVFGKLEGQARVSGSSRHPAVEVKTIDEQEVIELHQVSTERQDHGDPRESDKDYKLSQITFAFSDQETADRFANGLRHAIAQSGGKVEPF